MLSGRSASLVSLRAGLFGDRTHPGPAHTHLDEPDDIGLDCCRPAFIKLPTPISTSRVAVGTKRHENLEGRIFVVQKLNSILRIMRRSAKIHAKPDSTRSRRAVGRSQHGHRSGHPHAIRRALLERSQAVSRKPHPQGRQSQRKRGDSEERLTEAVERLCISMSHVSLQDISPDVEGEQETAPPIVEDAQIRSESRRRGSSSSVFSSASSSSLQTLVEEKDLCEMMDCLSLHSPKCSMPDIISRNSDFEGLSSESEQAEWWDEFAFLRDESTSTPKDTSCVFPPELHQQDYFWNDDVEAVDFSHLDDETASSCRSTATSGSGRDEVAAEQRLPYATASQAATHALYPPALQAGLASRTCFVGIRNSWHTIQRTNSMALFAPAFLTWAAS